MASEGVRDQVCEHSGECAERLRAPGSSGLMYAWADIGHELHLDHAFAGRHVRERGRRHFAGARARRGDDNEAVAASVGRG